MWRIDLCHVIDTMQSLGDAVVALFVAVEVNMETLSTFSTLKSLTNAQTVRGRPNLKDVERFRNGSNFIYRGREHSIVKRIVSETYRETYCEPI